MWRRRYTKKVMTNETFCSFMHASIFICTLRTAPTLLFVLACVCRASLCTWPPCCFDGGHGRCSRCSVVWSAANDLRNTQKHTLWAEASIWTPEGGEKMRRTMVASVKTAPFVFLLWGECSFFFSYHNTDNCTQHDWPSATHWRICRMFILAIWIIVHCVPVCNSIRGRPSTC